MKGFLRIIIALFLPLTTGACGIMGTEVGNGVRPPFDDGSKRKTEAGDTASTAPNAEPAPDQKTDGTASDKSQPTEAKPASTTTADNAGAPEAAALTPNGRIFNLLTSPCITPWAEALAKGPRLERTAGEIAILTVTLGANNAVQITSSLGQSRVVTRKDGAELQPVTVTGDDHFRDYAAANFRCSSVLTETNISMGGRTALVRRTLLITDASGANRIVWYTAAAAQPGKVDLVRIEVTLGGMDTVLFESR